MTLGDQLGVMYRVESSNNREKKQIKRQKLKTVFFFGLDLIVFVLCLSATIKMFKRWDNCYYDFNAWSILVSIFSFFSLLLNFLQYHTIKLNENYLDVDEYSTPGRMASAAEDTCK